MKCDLCGEMYTPVPSIVNILLLRGKLSLPEGAEIVAAEQLLEYLGDLILSYR